jgi:hypothetical protein
MENIKIEKGHNYRQKIESSNHLLAMVAVKLEEYTAEKVGKPGKY